MVLESPAQVPGLELVQATRGEAGLAENSDNKVIGFPMFLGLDAAPRMEGTRRMVALARMASFHAHQSRQVAAGQEDSAVLADSSRAGHRRRRVRRGSGDTRAS